MLKRGREKNMYCSRKTSSGKQKKIRSSSQPQFCRKNTPATCEAHRILLALQQLLCKSHSTSFDQIISGMSKWSRSLTAAKPTIDGKCNKLELFDHLF